MSDPMLSPEADQLDLLARKAFRRSALIGGIVSIITGLVLLIWPESTLLVIAAIVGIWLIVAGIIRLVEALTIRTLTATVRLFAGLVGVAYLVIGVLLLQNLFDTLRVVAAIIGLIWIVGGLAEIVTAIGRRAGGWAMVGGILMGLLSAVAGLVVLVWPGVTLLVLVWIAGLWLVLLGLLQLGLWWLARAQ